MKELPFQVVCPRCFYPGVGVGKQRRCARPQASETLLFGDPGLPILGTSLFSFFCALKNPPKQGQNSNKKLRVIMVIGVPGTHW